MRNFLASRVFHFCLGVGVSLGLVYWLYRKLEWNQIGEQLLQTNHLIFFPITAVFVLQFIIRSLRWRYLLPEGRPLPLVRLYDGIILGNFGNYVLPLRAGEFVRPYVLTRECGLSFSSAFVSVIIERFFDLSVVLISFGVVLLMHDSLEPWVYQGAGALSLLACGLLVFMIVGGRYPIAVRSAADRLFKVLPARAKLTSFLGDFLSGAAVLRDGRRLTMIVLLSVLVWLVTFFQFYLTLVLLGMHASFDFAVSITVIVALAVAAPSAPGFIGVYEAGCIAAFALFGHPESDAGTYAIISHVYQYVFIVVSGFFLLLRYGIKLSDLLAARGSDLSCE